MEINVLLAFQDSGDVVAVQDYAVVPHALVVVDCYAVAAVQSVVAVDCCAVAVDCYAVAVDCYAVAADYRAAVEDYNAAVGEYYADVQFGLTAMRDSRVDLAGG